MRCKNFEFHLDEWVSGRLADSITAAMDAHALQCGPCAHAARLERDLAARFATARQATPARDLHAITMTRIADRKQSRPLFVPGWAAACACVMLFTTVYVFRAGSPIKPPADDLATRGVDESRIIRLVSESRGYTDSYLELLDDHTEPSIVPASLASDRAGR